MNTYVSSPETDTFVKVSVSGELTYVFMLKEMINPLVLSGAAREEGVHYHVHQQFTQLGPFKTVQYHCLHTENSKAGSLRGEADT